MKKWKVIHRVFLEEDGKSVPYDMEMVVEAGSKKMASITAMREMSKDEKYKGMFKAIMSVEEVTG